MTEEYNLPQDEIHFGILKKFNFLKGTLIYGQKDIKGTKGSGKRVQPDQFVSEEHILHDLIRGFYKPKGKDYILSYQATEKLENYGMQIGWIDNTTGQFSEIKMLPPSGHGDKRAVGDINAARYNLNNKIPIGILHRVKKGINRCLGLGIIQRETEDGIFIVKPIALLKDVNSYNDRLEDFSNISVTEKESLIKTRIGQSNFKKELQNNRKFCQLCHLSKKELLVASHIKPWRESSPFEKLDLLNGLLLCPNHDSLFDKGYISFMDDGRVIISEKIDNNASTLLNINDEMVISVIRGTRKILIMA